MGVVQKLCDWEEKERGGKSGEGAERRKEQRFGEMMNDFFSHGLSQNQPKGSQLGYSSWSKPC